MRKLAVCVDFISDGDQAKISQMAENLGFQTSYFTHNDPRLPQAISQFEVIFGNPAPELLSKADHLQWLSSAFAGVAPYLREDIWPRPDCLLTSGSGAYGPTISEHVVMVLLMLMRRMPEYQADAAQYRWAFHTPIRSIAGSQIVMLGTGDIGSNTARRLSALGAEVTGVCRSGRSKEPAFTRVIPLERLDSVLPQADAMVMALPETSETAGILSRSRLALLPSSAYVINVGRGSAIDQEALVEALWAGKLAGAALDVMTPEPLPENHPLWDCPNTIITPHVSGNMSLGITCDLAVELFCQNLERYAVGKPLNNLVDRIRGY